MALGIVPGIQAAPLNDDFANAISLAGTNFSWAGDTTGATLEPGEPRHGDTGATGSLWYEWTAPATGRIVIDPNVAPDELVIAVYLGGSVTNLTQIDHNRSGLGMPGQAVVPVERLDEAPNERVSRLKW